MENLQFLYSDDGSFLITSSQRVADRYDNKGFDRSASFFDSYTGDSSRLVRGFIDKDTGKVHYATSGSERSEYKKQGYSKIGGSFSVSLKPGDGLKAIYELEKDGLTSYVPASLRKSYTKNGYVNNGLAWYSPINTGNIRISDIAIGGGGQSAGVDEITGSLVFNYEVDNLHSAQFIGAENTLSFRVLVEGVDGTLYSQSLADIDIVNSPDPLVGTISTDFIGEPGLSLEDIASIDISGVAKYGMSSTVEANSLSSRRLDYSNASDQLDNGYTFFRANSVQLSGDSLRSAERFNSTPMKELAPKYFDLSPIYENKTFQNLNFRGAGLQNVNCLRCNFKGNDFTGAEMSGFYSLKADGPGGEVLSPSYSRENPNKFNGIVTGTPGNRYDTIFGVIPNGNPDRNNPWYVGEFTGAQMTKDSFQIQYYYQQTQGNASMISVENFSTRGDIVRLDYLNSETMEIGATRLSGNTRYMKAYGYRQKKYYDQGLYDVEGSVSYNGWKYIFAAKNPATEARFFLGSNRGDLKEMNDDGMAAFLRWEYTGSPFGTKSWKLSVVDWTPPSQSADSPDEILPVFEP